MSTSKVQNYFHRTRMEHSMVAANVVLPSGLNSTVRRVNW